MRSQIRYDGDNINIGERKNILKILVVCLFVCLKHLFNCLGFFQTHVCFVCELS